MSRITALPESELIEICRRPVAPCSVEWAALHLLDWLGCVVAAHKSPVALALGRVMGGAQTGVLGRAFSPDQTDAQTAALLTGALGNVLEMDDLHRGSILHAGDTICAAALAVALRQDTNGADLLAAVTRGYEVAIRIGLVAASGGYTPFYNSGTCAVFGTAIAASDLKGLGAEGMADALGQAGMQAAGIWQCRLEPTFSKQLACAHAARAGVLSAELAAVGFPGARQILTGPLGFFASYYPKADQAALISEPDREWAIHQVSFKPFPACRHTHPAISAALEARRSAQTLKRVHIHTYQAALDFCDAPSPATPDEARFSLQHAVAVALLRGPPGIADFDDVALRDPALTALRDKITLHVDPQIDAGFPARYAARLTLVMLDGAEINITCPAAWGDPENPMLHTDLVTKFTANAAHGGLSQDTAAALVECVLNLPHAPDMSDLQRALTAALPPKIGECLKCP